LEPNLQFATKKFDDLPLPPKLLPPKLATPLQLLMTTSKLRERFGLTKLQFDDWWRYVVSDEASKRDFTDPARCGVFLKFLQQPLNLAQLTEDKLLTLSFMRIIPTKDGRMESPNRVYLPNVHNPTKLPIAIIHGDMMAKHGLTEEFLKAIGIRINVHVQTLIGSLPSKINGAISRSILATVLSTHHEMTEEEWNYLRNTPFCFAEEEIDIMATKDESHQATEPDAAGDGLTPMHLIVPTRGLRGMGLPLLYLPSFDEKADHTSVLKELGVHEYPELQQLLERITEDDSGSDVASMRSLTAIRYLDREKVHYLGHLKDDHGWGDESMAVVPTNQGLQSHGDCFLDESPQIMRFPVVLPSARGIAAFIGVASKPPLEAVASKAIAILSLDSDDEGSANETDRAHIWEYLATRFRHDDGSYDSESNRANATEKLANAKIIRTAFGFVSPSEAFVGTNDSVRAAFNGIEMWDEAQSHACATELQATQSLTDYGVDSNQLIEQLGGKSLEGASSTELILSQLLIANAEQLSDQPQALCCLIGGALKHSGASHAYVPQLRAAPLLNAVERHGDQVEEATKMVRAASAYFVDGNEPLMAMANPRFTVPTANLPPACAFAYEMLGTKSVSDAVNLRLSYPDDDGAVEPTSIPEFDRAIRRRSALLLFALGQKIKFTRARRWEADILQTTKALLESVSVFFVPDLQQELSFEEKKLAVQETSSLYEKDSGRIFLSDSKGDFELVSYELAHAFIIANTERMFFGTEGSFASIRDFALTVHFALTTDLKVLKRMHYPVTKASIEAEEQEKKEAEEQAKKEAEEKARREAEEKAKKEAEEKARREAEDQAERDAAEKTRGGAEEQAKLKAEEQARKKEVEEKARNEAETQARKEAEEKARKEAEEQAKKEAEEEPPREGEEKAKKNVGSKAKVKAEAKAEQMAERQSQADKEREQQAAKLEAERRAKTERDAEPQKEAAEHAEDRKERGNSQKSQQDADGSRGGDEVGSATYDDDCMESGCITKSDVLGVLRVGSSLLGSDETGATVTTTTLAGYLARRRLAAGGDGAAGNGSAARVAAVYFLAAANRQAAESDKRFAEFKALGVELLLVISPVEQYVFKHAQGFQGVPLVSVDGSMFSMDAVRTEAEGQLPRATEHDCVVGDWSSWQSCSHACGGGSEIRRRSVLRAARSSSPGALPCPTLRHSRPCNTHACADAHPKSEQQYTQGLGGDRRSSPEGDAGAGWLTAEEEDVAQLTPAQVDELLEWMQAQINLRSHERRG
jgi:hypothetical protein